MRRTALLLLLLAFSSDLTAGWEIFDITCRAGLDGRVESYSYASYSHSYGNIQGYHKLEQQNSTYYILQRFDKSGSTYSGYLRTSGAPGECFQGSLYALFVPWPGFGSNDSFIKRSNNGWFTCVPYPPERCTVSNGCVDPTCPLVVNTGKGGWRLTGLDEPVAFDYDFDGTAEKTAWTAAGSDLAFVVMDRNGNGRIDDGRELFGEHTILRSGARAKNGFEALAELDANGDGEVDASDPAWARLLLWTDRDHDGASAPGELAPISASDILGLSVSYKDAARKDPNGNYLRYLALARRAAGREPFYDVFFVTERQ